MPVHPFQAPRGRLVTIEIESDALRDNLCGDPPRRAVALYLPERYDDSDDSYPLLVDLAGFTGSGLKHLSWQAFAETLPQRIDRLVAEGLMGPVIVAFPDCFTSIGGNQYIDSLATGRWEEFLTREMIGAIESSFRVRRGRQHRAVFGKSSGGYGAIVHGMRHADTWGAVACHSGDMGFELVYRGDFPKTLDALARHGGSMQAFLDKLAEYPKIGGGDFHALMTLAMGAHYDPDPAAPKGLSLPVDPHTCEILPERWEKWLAHDPMHLIDREECRDNLARLSGVYLDCGFRDQYFIHYGTRAFVRKLEAYGIPHHYEEFDDDHSQVDYRMDASLPFLYRALAA